AVMVCEPIIFAWSCVVATPLPSVMQLLAQVNVSGWTVLTFDANATATPGARLPKPSLTVTLIVLMSAGSALILVLSATMAAEPGWAESGVKTMVAKAKSRPFVVALQDTVRAVLVVTVPVTWPAVRPGPGG